MESNLLPPPVVLAVLRDSARQDTTRARRYTLARLLLHERYLTRSQLIIRVEGMLGARCFGDAAREDTFYRDMRAVKAALQAAGHTLAYSRSAARPGYYLRGEGAISDELARQIDGSVAEIDLAQLDIFRRMTPAERFRLGCSVTDTARNAVAYRLRLQYPQLSAEEASYWAIQGRRREEP